MNYNQVANTISTQAEVRAGRLDEGKGILEPPEEMAEALTQLLMVIPEAPSVTGGRHCET